jgi:hypothetical protein
MKHLLNGVAIAAALAFAAPVWAQQQPQYNPATPGATGTGAPMTPAPAEPSSATIPAHHAMHHAHAMHAHHMRMAKQAHAAGDTTAALNRQELARIQSGAPPVPPSGPMGEGPPGSPQPAPSH